MMPATRVMFPSAGAGPSSTLPPPSVSQPSAGKMLFPAAATQVT